MPSTDEHRKRIPTPRRLFSFDSVRSSSSANQEGSGHQHAPRKASAPVRSQATSDDEYTSGRSGRSREHEPAASTRGGMLGGFDLRGSGSHTTSAVYVTSPISDSQQVDSTNEPESERTTPGYDIPIKPVTSDLRPSRARWEHLRQHFLPPPAVIPEGPGHHVPSTHVQSSSLSSSILIPPSRSSTPKPSRLARLGFRQVVHSAQEVQDKRKFEDDVLKACWSNKYMELHKARVDRETIAMVGPSHYMPFKSTISVNTAGAASSQTTSSTKKQELYATQSSPSLAGSYFAAPSIKPLYQMLHLYSVTPSDDASPFAILPHEHQILSTLLSPFLTSSKVTKFEEQNLAIQTFEMICDKWKPYDEAIGVERCLWCCKAALPPSPARRRVLDLLWRMIVSGEKYPPPFSPRALHAIAFGLFSLFAALHLEYFNEPNDDVILMKDMINHFSSGSYAKLDESLIEEEYATPLKNEKSDAVRNAIILESLMICMENSSQETHVWLLQNFLEDIWKDVSKTELSTPLLIVIHSRAIVSFSRGAKALLSSETLQQNTKMTVTDFIGHILQSNTIPIAEIIQTESTLMSIVHLVLELLCLEDSRKHNRWASLLISRWYTENLVWKQIFETTLKKTISGGNWPARIRVVSSLVKNLPPDVRRPIVTFALPIMNDQLVEEPPPFPFLPLSSLLETLSHLYPPLFYKPLFSCAASSKEFTVVNHLCILTVHSKFVADYWFRDPEMMSVALMSDTSGQNGTIGTSTGSSRWGKARLGQSVLLIELIGKMQDIRRAKEASSAGSEGAFAEAIRFATVLESRITILLGVKERTALIPPSQRMLLCMLFREFRLLTRSLRNAPWLKKVTSWFLEFYAEDELSGEIEFEVSDASKQIQGLYLAAYDGVNQSHKRVSTILLESSSNMTSDGQRWDIAISFAENKQLIDSLAKGFPSKAMKLLVTMSSLLTAEECKLLGPVIWQESLKTNDTSSIASACYLLMQCAEKSPLDLLAILEVDLQTSDDDTRLDAVQKIGALISWRFQIMSQTVITDRAHRQFKVARPPLPFVPTDMGSTLYIFDEEPSELQSNVPVELRKRLAEIGWADDNTNGDHQQDWVKTPLSLLPANQRERLDPIDLSRPSHSSEPTPQSSPRRTPSPRGQPEEEGLLRRNSSSGGPTYKTKRRALFVPSLALIFPRLVSLVVDSNFVVASMAQDIIMDLMRNDPSLLIRPILDMCSGDEKDVASAMSIFALLIHIRPIIPPPMTHAVFNSVAGFLKLGSRQVDVNETLQEFSYSIPILARIVAQVSGMSIREIRRSKMDHFFIPSGALWFPSSAPNVPMFPKGPQNLQNMFSNPLTQLTSVTMIRVSQNLLFLSMLKQNRQDLHLVRKNMLRLVLPSMLDQSEARPLELNDFSPAKPSSIDTVASHSDNIITVLSLILSRSYLLLVAQIFRSMSRHLGDRNELAVLVDGVNRILLAHGDDIGIVTQAMIALMVAATRFRRLFTSGGGYSLFMPAIIKVYTQSNSNIGIRMALEYTISRFYAHHREAFLFQSLESIARISMLHDAETEYTGKGIYSLFFSLSKASSRSSPDAAGIHNVNKAEEREALMIATAEESPHTFLNSVRRADSYNGKQASVELPEEYESLRLGMDDFVRLFLTVIAHDPSSTRAEQFLRLLRFLTPYLFHTSTSTRSIIQEGIAALCSILNKANSKPKGEDLGSSSLSSEKDSSFFVSEVLDSQLSEKSKIIGNIGSMRLDFLKLVLNFGRAGGIVSLPAARQVIDLVKIVLKENNADSAEPISVFLSEFVAKLLIRDERPSVKAVTAFIQELTSIFHANMATIDLSGILKTLHILSADQMYATDPRFMEVIFEICSVGLAAFDLAASERRLFALSCRESMISLLSNAVHFPGKDIISEIEQRTPSYSFLAGVVLPLVLSMKTAGSIGLDNVSARIGDFRLYTSIWIRVLSYLMAVCKEMCVLKTMRRSKSRDKRRSGGVPPSQLPSFIVCLQVLKVVILRAHVEIGSVPGIWERISSFLQTVLADGNAEFALNSNRSSLPSPTASPGNVEFTESGLLQNQLVKSPRIVDYALWSILEFVCSYRNPLRLHMRLFLVEKIVTLDGGLRHEQAHKHPFQRPPNTNRLSTSVFVKPRRQSASPDSSPSVSAAPPIDSSYSLSSVRRAGYQMSPMTPSSAPQKTYFGPKIIHLGPTSLSPLRYSSLTPGATGDTREMKDTALQRLRSRALIQATYRRIRGIQLFMGHDLLLQVSQGREEPLETWTKKQAINAIMSEMKELLDEFDGTTLHNSWDATFSI